MEVEPIDTGEGVTDDQEAEMAVTKKETGTPGAATVGSSEEGRPFICGVVEGFYNRPWTQNQRVDLYKKLNTFGLNAYLYAPKDDVKHRALWREKYDPQELQKMKILIDGCRENDVIFYYGISPGLDMTYSSAEDLARLKAKLDQLVSVGCRGFAVLWDDIDTHLRPADVGAFNTLADAHVKICNQAYEHLKSSNSCFFRDDATRANWFLTCPVEYCSNRADPNVAQSPYLNTLGAGLDPEIGIFWTGSKVVSEVITKDEILCLSRVLRRKPLIWDNLHANDYDQQRMFLGPYSGRSPDLIPLLMGVFTNPNCEYSLNVPALFTLAAWSNCYNPRTGAISSWNPTVAAELCIPHFLEEIHRPTMVAPVGPDKDDPASAANVNIQKQHIVGISGELDRDDIELLLHFFWLPHSHGPKAQITLNYFKQLLEDAHIIQKLGLYNKRDGEMVDEPHGAPAGSSSSSTPVGCPVVNSITPEVSPSRTSSGDLSMTDGTPGAGGAPPTHGDMEDLHESLTSLQEPRPEKNLRSTWLRKASYFNEICRRYSRLFDKLTFMENRELFFDMNAYMTNLNFTLQSCNRFLKWVGVERCMNSICGGPTLSGLPGGVAGDLMRLYPVRSNSQYPLQNFEVLTPNSSNTVVKPLILRKQLAVLGPAFSRLVCESHGVSEADVPEDVVRVLQNQRVGAFLNSCPVAAAAAAAGDSVAGGCVGGPSEPAASLVPPPPIGATASGISGSGSVEGNVSGPAALLGTGDNVKAVVVEDLTEDSKVIGAIVGSRHVTNVVKTLQQVFDTAKTLNSNHLPISLPDDELPWYSLSSYDVLMTFAATPKLLYTKALASALTTFFDHMMVVKAGGVLGASPMGGDAGVGGVGGGVGGVGPPPPSGPVTKYGILMEKTSLISIEFLIDQGFRKVGNYSSFVVLDIEIPHQ